VSKSAAERDFFRLPQQVADKQPTYRQQQQQPLQPVTEENHRDVVGTQQSAVRKPPQVETNEIKEQLPARNRHSVAVVSDVRPTNSSRLLAEETGVAQPASTLVPQIKVTDAQLANSSPRTGSGRLTSGINAVLNGSETSQNLPGNLVNLT